MDASLAVPICGEVPEPLAQMPTRDRCAPPLRREHLGRSDPRQSIVSNRQVAGRACQPRFSQSEPAPKSTWCPTGSSDVPIPIFLGPIAAVRQLQHFFLCPGSPSIAMRAACHSHSARLQFLRIPTSCQRSFPFSPPSAEKNQGKNSSSGAGIPTAEVLIRKSTVG